MLGSQGDSSIPAETLPCLIPPCPLLAWACYAQIGILKILCAALKINLFKTGDATIEKLWNVDKHQKNS